MSGQQQIIGAGGAGLVVLSFWQGPSRATINAGLFTKDATAAQETAAKRELTKLAGALLFVVVGTLLAGISSTWANTMTAVIVGLFLLWAINKYNA